MRTRRFALLTACVLFAASCGTTFSSLTPIDSGTNIASDPQGDAGPAPTLDIIELRSIRGASELQVRLWTSPDPVLPPPGAVPSGTQISGGIGFNTDLNRATGTAFAPPCGPGSGLDRFIDLSVRNPDGTYNVLDASLAVVGTATVSQDGPRLTFVVTFATLGSLAGRTEASAVAGFNTLGGFSGRDCAPDAGQALPTRARTNQHRVLW